VEKKKGNYPTLIGAWGVGTRLGQWTNEEKNGAWEKKCNVTANNEERKKVQLKEKK